MNETARISALNDVFRRSACGPMLVNGQLVVTQGVLNRGEDFLARAILAVRSHTDFTEDNDPYGEHDFGSFTLDGQKLFWKIDCYHTEFFNTDTIYFSPDPSDPEITTRVLTIMLASEY